MSLSGGSLRGLSVPWRNNSLMFGGGQDPPLSDHGETVIGVYLLLLGDHTHTRTHTYCIHAHTHINLTKHNMLSSGCCCPQLSHVVLSCLMLSSGCCCCPRCFTMGYRLGMTNQGSSNGTTSVSDKIILAFFP
ncbi:opsin-5-like [Solea senegalensis]|uniref:Opsin-5-like n=1 Tax=Solea senegalensis TaxID=28829 RepID=A0AAV6Q8D0_SOLSE|nr:opsin-5-like [Solea senegalensis]